jgi:nitronate monooxygenase
MLPPILQGLALPVICSPMLIASYPELVIAQCKAGVVGAFPALNARPAERLGHWLDQINDELDAFKAHHPNAAVGPVAVNQIVHKSNARLEEDLRVCVDHEVPIYITSLRAPVREVLDAVHRYGGIVLHDVTTLRHAHKALEAGVDGLILVAAGAGGHAGTLSPFALVGEVRRVFGGPVVLGGAIASGEAILAAQAMGADLAYVGTRFIASDEANVTPRYKSAIVAATAADIVYTDFFTGVRGNYMRQSIVDAGLDPDHLPQRQDGQMDFSSTGSDVKGWRDIWGAGQGVGLMDEVLPVAQIIRRLAAEYETARRRVLAHQVAATAAADEVRRSPALLGG